MISFKTLLVSVTSLVLCAVALAGTEAPPTPETFAGYHRNMYVIEREMPGLGKLTPEELKNAARKSCDVLKNLGPQITWLQSFVTGDKMYCVYLAPNEEMVREHAKEGGFPANAVNRVTTIIGPKTAD